MTGSRGQKKRRCHSAPQVLPTKKLKHSCDGEESATQDRHQAREWRLRITPDEKESEVFVPKRSETLSDVSFPSSSYPSSSSSSSSSVPSPPARSTRPSLQRGPFDTSIAEERLSSSGTGISSSEEESSSWTHIAQQTARRSLQERGVLLLHRQDMQALARLEGEWLGAGGFGSCFKVVDPLRGKLVVKTIYDSALSVLLTEAINLQQLQGPGVQRLFGACVETCQLVTHYAGHTTDQYFQVCHPLADIASVFLQVTLALQEIIRKGFTHNDIKGSNVCVATPGTGPVATVIDLGLARRLGARGLYGGGLSVMRLPWVAPEIVRDKRPTSEASDVFSLAAMMQRVLGLARGCPYPPTQAALALWLHDALSPDPEERPALEELVEMLEVLLEAVKSAHPPPAKGTSGQTRKRR